MPEEKSNEVRTLEIALFKRIDENMERLEQSNARMNVILQDVLERVIRIEAQDHAEEFKAIRLDREKLEARVREAENSITKIRTQLAPILFLGSSIGGALVLYFIRGS